MRRTRHVALPVRAWQYIGLLIVSLACLTLGLVSRDKEGRAGSLAGPELEHRAPHEVDACPNSNFFAKVPPCSILEQDHSRDPKMSEETGIVQTSPTSANSRISRSRTLDRDSRARLQSRTDFRSAERVARQGINIDNDSSRRIPEAKLRTKSQDRESRRSSDPATRLSRSLSLDDARRAARSLDRRSRSTEGRSIVVDRRETRGTSHSVDRRRSTVLDRDNRLEIRVRRVRSLELQKQNHLERQDRRSPARTLARQDLRRDSRANSEENRRNSVASRGQDSRSLIRAVDNSRRFERTTESSRMGRQASRSLDRRESRTVSDFANQGLSRRLTSMEGRRASRLQSRNNEASRERESLARPMELRSTESRQERNSRNAERGNRVQFTTRRDSRSNQDYRMDNSRQREESRVRLAREMRDTRTQLVGQSETARRDLERRVRDVSSERRATILESVNKENVRTDRRLLGRSRSDNLERRENTGKLNLPRESRTLLARSTETTKRDFEHRIRSLSNDRRSSERRSTVSESANRQKIRTDRHLSERSRLNSVEHRERTNRQYIALETRNHVARLSETSKRGLERHVRDLSNDRRSLDQRSTVLESAYRQEVRSDRRLSERSRFNGAERRERTNKQYIALESPTPVVKSSETAKRDLERRVRDLSNDRRSSERRSTVLETPRRQEVRTNRLMLKRSSLDNVERRERSNKVLVARESRNRLFRSAETAKRDFERRVRNVSSERRATIIESVNKENVRTDRRLLGRSRSDNLERRENTGKLNLPRESRTLLARSTETAKRDFERRVRNLSNDQRSSERRSTVPESVSRQGIRTDAFERRERTNKLYLARESRIPLARVSETVKRDLERRVRDLSNDRRSSERRSTVLESANREELRSERRLSERSRLNSVERRERVNKQYLAVQSRSPLARSSKISKRDLEPRVRDLSSDRHSSERRSIVLESVNKQDVRTDRRERTNKLHLARESRSLLARSAEISKRDVERRVRNLYSERRSASSQSENRQEVRNNGRLSERSRLDNLERRGGTNRLSLARESRIPFARSSEVLTRNLDLRRVRNGFSDRRLEREQLVNTRRFSRATVLESLSRADVRSNRRLLEEKLERRALGSNSLRQGFNINRLRQARAIILTNDLRSNQRRQRLTERTRATLRSRLQSDVKRSRFVDLELTRFADKASRSYLNLKDSMDLYSLRKQVTSSHVPGISANNRSSASRETISSSINNALDYLEEKSFIKNALSFEIIRQALVIGLCTLYSLSIFQGKRSFIR
ncbi:uncharacterized protein LOC128874233 isoform X2 [Hylaeus volcanicus]|uniref:uncharacterized protein LOC128874233 isoform X2 n=1 Tax=Hylaeus volcanicus TaxID=313075 RepID=UPI0023B81DFE|nr:uncharacterized protein LOC128874233 isoform X2 [Hylaeus volcanicus]